MELKFCILDADWVLADNTPVVRLWGKTESGKTAVVLDDSYQPYFYVLPKHDANIERLKGKIARLSIEGRRPERIDIVGRKLLGQPTEMLKVTASNPRDIEKLRDVVKEWRDVKEEYEHGLTFYRKYIIDKGLVPMEWVSVSGEEVHTDLRVDIAVKASHIRPAEGKEIFPRLNILVFDLELAEENGEEKIIMASLKDSRGFERVLTYKNAKARGVEVLPNERGLIARLLEIIDEKDPDIICGYNTDRFDFVKLEERARKLKIPLVMGRDNRPVFFHIRGKISSAQIKGRVHIDLYDFVEHILAQTLTSEVLTLDRVAEEILGTGKKEKMKWKDIEAAWKTKKGIEKLVEYSKWDAELTMDLAGHILPQIFELCKLTGQTPFDASRMTYSQLVEWLLIRKVFELGEIAFNRPKFEEMQIRKRAEAYSGGYVHPPREGIHENIALFDFRSLYPSIIVSHDVSPETLDCQHAICQSNRVPEDGHWYCMQQKGFVPQILEELIKKRAAISSEMKKVSPQSLEWRALDNKQFALKILANAFYGYYGYAGSRWYSRICAQAITAWGRFYIKKVIKMAESKGLEVLYGDTDSLFLKISDEKEVQGFLDEVNKTLPGIMELEFKDIYKRGIFIEAKTGFAAKKKYALLDRSGQLVIRGMETRRRDWAKIAKDTQEAVLQAILKERSNEMAVERIQETIEELRRGKVALDKLVIYEQITKPLNRYEHIGPHVRAAQKSVQRGRPVSEGTVISYIITKGTGSISERAEPAEDAKNYDPDYYIRHQVIPPALRILSRFGITEEDLLRTKKSDQLTLKKYIKGEKKRGKKDDDLEDEDGQISLKKYLKV